MGFVLFVVVVMGLVWLLLLDLFDVIGELVGGVEVEYIGVWLVVLWLVWMVIILVLVGVIVIFYLGGWLGLWLFVWVWSVIKILVVVVVMLSVGCYMLCICEVCYLVLSWKLGILLVLVNIFVVGVIVLVVLI